MNNSYNEKGVFFMASEQNQLVIQFLERIVDENIKSSEKISNIKFVQEEQRREVNNILSILRNGLKDDIKDHFSAELEKHIKRLGQISEKQDELFKEIEDHRERNKDIDGVLRDIRKKGIWFRGTVALVVAIATIFGAVITISKITGWTNTQKTSTAIPQQQAP